jgi:hypothetical protein
MDFISIAGSGKTVLRFVTPQHRLAGIIELPLVHRSSGIFAASLTRVQPTLLTSSLITMTPESRMSTDYSLLSLSSSATNLLHSVTFFLPVIQPTDLARSNRVTAHSYNASKT